MNINKKKNKQKMIITDEDSIQPIVKNKQATKQVKQSNNEPKVENNFVEPKSKINLNIENINNKSNIKIVDDEEKIQNEKKDMDKDTNIKKLNDKIIENKEVSSDENNNIFLKELLSKQLKNICPSKKLSYGDIIRISKFLNVSIFDNEKCSLWSGYITNENNKSKGTYINFYFNKKKIALHRLLFINYVDDISNDEYIKFSCDNKGKCCNINHMNKYCYNKTLEANINKKLNEEQDLLNKKDPKLQINTDKKKLTVEF